MCSIYRILLILHSRLASTFCRCPAKMEQARYFRRCLLGSYHRTDLLGHVYLSHSLRVWWEGLGITKSFWYPLFIILSNRKLWCYSTRWNPGHPTSCEGSVLSNGLTEVKADRIRSSFFWATWTLLYFLSFSAVFSSLCNSSEASWNFISFFWKLLFIAFNLLTIVLANHFLLFSSGFEYYLWIRLSSMIWRFHPVKYLHSFWCLQQISDFRLELFEFCELQSWHERDHRYNSIFELKKAIFSCWSSITALSLIFYSISIEMSARLCSLYFVKICK